MTDNDIIKALECFAAHYDIDNVPCDKCAFAKEKNLCTAIMSIDMARITLDLINRQKAEIERLQSMNQSKLDMIHDVRAELEIARAEAITVFAERLTIHFGTYTDKDYLRVLDMVRLIDQIAKEMKEGVNNA